MTYSAKELMALAKLIAEGDGHFSPLECREAVKYLLSLVIEKEALALNVRHSDCHKAADAFWKYWNENGETHKHGYYESTWGAINRALRTVGVVRHQYRTPTPPTSKEQA